MKHHPSSSVHSGNYYTAGASRVVAKLKKLGIPIPDGVLSAPRRVGNFSPLEHAVMDWFSSNDYDQAQALVHRKEASRQWYIITIQDFDRTPPELSDGMLCPSIKDAVTAVLLQCDQSLVRVETARQENGGIVFVIDGHDTIQIQPITLEPFNLEIRDRVRNAFKGLRQHLDDFYGRLKRLPGYKGIAFEGKPEHSPNGGMLLGFPGNWALAMRNALEQVGIAVKQSQAQELVAVFLGASDWHQLVRHEDDPALSAVPVAVAIAGRRTFYHTTEEAIFATGKHIEHHDIGATLTPIQQGGMSFYRNTLALSLAKKSELESMDPMDRPFCPAYIQTGANDYWLEGEEGQGNFAEAAHQLLAALDESDKDQPHRSPFDQGMDNSTMLVAMLARAGIPESQIVFMGDYALAVSYNTPPGAWLQVYHLAGNTPRKIPNGDIAMHKATAKIVEADTGPAIHIAGDYGRATAIQIPITHWALVQRFANLVEHPSISSQLVMEYGNNITPIRRKIRPQ